MTERDGGAGPAEPLEVTKTVSYDIDGVLAWLVGLLREEVIGEFAIILWTPAGVLYGDVVSGQRWARELRERVGGAAGDAGQTFADTLEPLEDLLRSAKQHPPRYIHLVNAETFLPDGTTFAQDLWRGHLSQVSGWTLGRPDVALD